jgi:hypothetical protein
MLAHGLLAGGAISHGIAGGFIFGGVAGGDLKSAFNGAVSGGAFGFVGDLSQTYKWGQSDLGKFKHAAAHAVTGGALSDWAGGDFRSGALGAGFASLGGHYLPGANNLAGRTIIGGISAQIGGGMFSNGAVTAAFAYLFNECAHGGCSSEGQTETKPLGSYLPGTEAGDSAAQYWADLHVQTGNPLYAVPGVFASMWTPDTAIETGLTLASAGIVALAERAGVLWMRAYPNAGGEGIGINWGGKNLIRLDWHRFTLNGETVFRPHVDIPSQGVKHWPW